MNGIKFGTDGWRAIVGKDFNIENVTKVINAISLYVYYSSKFDKKIIIGYDPRNKAGDFALYSANMLVRFGFDVELCNKITPTPVIAYTALKKDAYALMFTASHNPPEYLGIKFIPPYGGPAEDNITAEISENLKYPFHIKKESGKLLTVSFDEDYIEHIKTIIDFEKIKSSGIKLNYDGLHGAAGGIFTKILDMYDIKCRAQNLERDVNFGGNMPDPKEKYLSSLKELCKETGTVGFSNDGDGDRFGCFDENGEFIKADEIICMLLKHLTKNKGYSGKLAKTVGAGSMTDIYAGKLGIAVVETAVGFKHLGAAMRNDDIIIAGEESGGLSIKNHIPEKDGIIAILLILEMMSYENKPLKDIHAEFLAELNRTFVNDRIDLKLTNEELKDKIIAGYKNFEKIGNYDIVRKNDIDGLKLYLNDGSTVLIRKSGTEPLLRIYIEADSKEKVAELTDILKRPC